MKKWEFHKIHTHENRHGWPVYIYPVIYIEYQPEEPNEYGGFEDFLSFGMGIKFLGYSWYWYFMRRVEDEQKEN